MESVRRFAAERRKSISNLVSPFFETNQNNGGAYCPYKILSGRRQETVCRRLPIHLPPSSPTVPLRNNNGRRRFSPHRRFTVTPGLLQRREREKEEEKAKQMEQQKAHRRFSTC
ncbi:hypothetical protein PMAYCL1PPCAC_24535, partial [Pristionchus mayeri]